MTNSFSVRLTVFVLLCLLMIAGSTIADDPGDNIKTAVISMENASRESFDWGAFHTYFQGSSFGTREVLTGVAVIKPGMEIHPPHKHAEEEYLMVLEGAGTWSVNGETFAAKAGDLLYAAPWDLHGLSNTGNSPLKFVVWKWNNKGLDVPLESK